MTRCARPRGMLWGVTLLLAFALGTGSVTAQAGEGSRHGGRGALCGLVLVVALGAGVAAERYTGVFSRGAAYVRTAINNHYERIRLEKERQAALEKARAEKLERLRTNPKERSAYLAEQEKLLEDEMHQMRKKPFDEWPPEMRQHWVDLRIQIVRFRRERVAPKSDELRALIAELRKELEENTLLSGERRAITELEQELALYEFGLYWRIYGDPETAKPYFHIVDPPAANQQQAESDAGAATTAITATPPQTSP